jgi:hypothetical protein
VSNHEIGVDFHLFHYIIFVEKNLGYGWKGSSTFELSLHCLSFAMKAHRRFIFKKVNQF